MNDVVGRKRFLFVSLDALITDVAWQVMREGHDVKYYIENHKEKEVGDGFVPKVDRWEDEIEWADVIVFDDVLGQGEKARWLRQQGKSVVGGTPYTDRLEDDRTFGQKELRRHGVPVVQFEDFCSFGDAIEYVLCNPARYVIKPSGNAQNNKRLLFVGEDDDGMDVLHILQSYQSVFGDDIIKFQLQKRVAGVEVAVGAFFNGRRFQMPINVNFEHKKLFPGNIGPSTGEMGTLMYWSEPNKIFNRTLKKMEGTFEREGYVGYVDLNCIVNGQGIYPLEFTARFGYPTISIQQEGMLTPVGELLYELANGREIELKVRRGFQVGVRVVVPPFPYDDEKTFDINSRDRIVLLKKQSRDGIHIEDVKMIKGEWVIAASSGVVLIVVGMGNTVRQAQAQVYGRLKNIMIPNMYYRTDIGDRWFEDSDRLHAWGYLRDW